MAISPPADPDDVSRSLTIRVEGRHRSYEALRRRGAEFLTSPNDRGAEIRRFFRDPDGHLSDQPVGVGAAAQGFSYRALRERRRDRQPPLRSAEGS